MPGVRKQVSGWRLTPTLVGWVVLGVMVLSLLRRTDLEVSQFTVYLVFLLFIAAIYPEVRRFSVRVPGAGIDWERELAELSSLLKDSPHKTQAIDPQADGPNDLFVMWRKGMAARRLLHLYFHLHQQDPWDNSRARLLDALARELTEADHSQT